MNSLRIENLNKFKGQIFNDESVKNYLMKNEHIKLLSLRHLLEHAFRLTSIRRY